MNSKAFFRSFFVFGLVALMAACSAPAGDGEGGDDKDSSKTANVEKVVKEVPVSSADKLAMSADIGIGGMTCSMGCAKSIEQNLGSMEGVANCEVDFDNKMAHITFDGESVSEDDMVKFINEFRDGTYSVTSLEVTKPVLKSAGGDTNGEEDDKDSEETAMNVSSGISFPNLFDAFSNLAGR